jgi:O-antigen/teichoic acid export membrane protein
MRFLSQRDQERSEGSFSLVWFLLIALLCPAVAVVQCLAPTLFRLWTHGKVNFDPVLFSSLSLGVLIYGLAQPAMAIAQGNNLLRVQITLSVLTASVTVGGIFALVSLIGLRGAGFALVLAETVGMSGYVWAAKRWLTMVGMKWPQRSFQTTALAVLIAALGMAAMDIKPGFAAISTICVCIAEIIVAVFYWRQLPQIIRGKVAAILLRFFPAGWRVRLATSSGGLK